MFFVASFSYVLDLVPPAERGWALGIYGVSGFVSTAVAPLFGEWIIRTVGFRALFLLSAALGLGTFLLVWPVREAPRGAGAPLRLAPGAVRAALEDVLHRHMFVTMFFGLGSGTIFAFLPTFAEDLGVTTLSLFYTAYSLAAIAVRIAGGRLIDTHGRRAVIVPSMFVQVAATATAGAARRPGDALERHAGAAGAVPGRPPVGRRPRLPLSGPGRARHRHHAGRAPRRRRRHLQRDVPRRLDGRRLHVRLDRQRVSATASMWAALTALLLVGCLVSLRLKAAAPARG